MVLSSDSAISVPNEMAVWKSVTAKEAAEITRLAPTFNIVLTAVIANETRGPTPGITSTTVDITLTKVLIVGRSLVNNETMGVRAKAKELAIPETVEIKPWAVVRTRFIARLAAVIAPWSASRVRLCATVILHKKRHQILINYLEVHNLRGMELVTKPTRLETRPLIPDSSDDIVVAIMFERVEIGVVLFESTCSL